MPSKLYSSNNQTRKVPFFHSNPYYLLGGWTDPTANYRLVKLSIIVKQFSKLSPWHYQVQSRDKRRCSSTRKQCRMLLKSNTINVDWWSRRELNLQPHNIPHMLLLKLPFCCLLRGCVCRDMGFNMKYANTEPQSTTAQCSCLSSNLQ